MLWLAPGNPIELPTTPASFSRNQDDNDQTNKEQIVAPLHPNNLSVTTSGSVRPVTASGLVVYARPDVEDDKKRRAWSDLGKENPTKPIGMGTAEDGPYNNGDPVVQRNDNQNYKTLKRKKHSEWLSRPNKNVFENMFSNLAQKVKGTFIRSPIKTIKSPEPEEHPWKVVKPGTSSRVTGQQVSQRLGSVTQRSDKPFDLTPTYNEKESGWVPNAWAHSGKEPKLDVPNAKTQTARLPKVIGDPEDTKMPPDRGDLKTKSNLKVSRTPLKLSKSTNL